MAQIEVKVPQLSESVAEATLLSWHKKTGEAVSRDENLIDIETDKVVLELPAPSAGVITMASITRPRNCPVDVLEAHLTGRMQPGPAVLHAPVRRLPTAVAPDRSRDPRSSVWPTRPTGRRAS